MIAASKVYPLAVYFLKMFPQWVHRNLDGSAGKRMSAYQPPKSGNAVLTGYWYFGIWIIPWISLHFGHFIWTSQAWLIGLSYAKLSTERYISLKNHQNQNDVYCSDHRCVSCRMPSEKRKCRKSKDCNQQRTGNVTPFQFAHPKSDYEKNKHGCERKEHIMT